MTRYFVRTTATLALFALANFHCSAGGGSGSHGASTSATTTAVTGPTSTVGSGGPTGSGGANGTTTSGASGASTTSGTAGAPPDDGGFGSGGAPGYDASADVSVMGGACNGGVCTLDNGIVAVTFTQST